MEQLGVEPTTSQMPTRPHSLTNGIIKQTIQGLTLRFALLLF